MKDYLFIDWYNEIITFHDTLNELDDQFDGCEDDGENNLTGYFIDPNDHDHPLKLRYSCFQGEYVDHTIDLLDTVTVVDEEDPYVLGA